MEEDDAKRVARECPVCGAAGAGPFLRKEALVLARCAECGMVYVPNPGAEFTGAAFYEGEGSAFYASEEKLAGDYAPVRYEREIGWVRRFCPRGRVLDVGCSTGGFLHQLDQRFPGEYRVLGNDVAQGALDAAESRGVPVLRESFFRLDGEAPFDAITFWAVLEHVGEPAAFLAQARRLLAENGRVFVLVPNVESLAMRILGARYRYVLPQHINYFSRKTLRQLLAKAGFESEAVRTAHFNPVVIAQDLRRNAGFVPERDRARLLRKTNALKASPLLLPLRLGYSSAEKLLGRLGLADNILIVARVPR